MSQLQELLHWWNAIYAAPLLFALIYLALANLLGVFAAGDHGSAETSVHADAHGGGDLHADVHAHVDHGHDLDAAHGHDAHAGDLPGEHAHTPGEAFGDAVHQLLALFGVGRAPIGLIVQVWVLLWGVIGLGINSLLTRALEPGAMVAASVPATFFAATLLTRALATLIGKYLPPVQSFVWSRPQFVGKMGEVAYPVTADAGTIHLHDGTGTIHRVRARAAHERLEPGQQIIVVGYDPDQDLYIVDDAVKFAERGD